MIVVPPGQPVPPAFCIDSLETTFSEYVVFLKEVNDGVVDPTGLLPPLCTDYSDFNPKGTTGSMWQKYQNDSASYGSYPVSGASWCDAYVYCKWAGKRLCGALSGGPTGHSDDELADNQWERACSKGQTPLSAHFPYGLAYDPEACHTGLLETDDTAPVGSHEGCEGGYPGIFDMSGNVAEWVDSCLETAPPDEPLKCIAVGGAFDQPSQQGVIPNPVSCMDNAYSYNAKGHRTGIRCCSLPL